MKTLELTVYPRRGKETYVLPHPRLCLGAVAVDRLSQAKRLTDAELAAEHWRAKWTGLWAEHNSGLNDERRAMLATVERFATLPHYDDPQHE